MCGRYAASTHPDKLIEIFEVDEVPDALPAVGPEGLAQWSRPRWNIAPTDLVPAVLERTREQAEGAASDPEVRTSCCGHGHPHW